MGLRARNNSRQHSSAKAPGSPERSRRLVVHDDCFVRDASASDKSFYGKCRPSSSGAGVRGSRDAGRAGSRDTAQRRGNFAARRATDAPQVVPGGRRDAGTATAAIPRILAPSEQAGRSKSWRSHLGRRTSPEEASLNGKSGQSGLERAGAARRPLGTLSRSSTHDVSNATQSHLGRGC